MGGIITFSIFQGRLSSANTVCSIIINKYEGCVTMAPKRYDSMRIMSLEGSVLCKNEGFTATNDDKPDPNAFRGILYPKTRRSVWSARRRDGLSLSQRQEAFEPYTPKIRKSGTGCVYHINDSLRERSFYPRLPDGKRKKFNVYAKTREECEEKLATMIAEKKAEIAAEKKKMKTA